MRVYSGTNQQSLAIDLSPMNRCATSPIYCTASAVVPGKRTFPDVDLRAFNQADEASGMSVENPRPPEWRKIGNIQGSGGTQQNLP